MQINLGKRKKEKEKKRGKLKGKLYSYKDTL